jgi:hypothetical protein
MIDLSFSVQAPFFPSLLWIISAWYKRHEVQTRISIFYLLSVTSGGLSPLLAYGLSLLEGKRNLEGWRWIFVSTDFYTCYAVSTDHPITS